MGDLRKQRDAAVAKVQKQLKEKLEQIANIIGENLESESYFDTGLYAANWHPETNSKATEDLDYDYFGIDASKVVHGNKTRVVTSAHALSISTDIPQFDLGDVVWWTNTSPYHDNSNNRIDAFSDAKSASEVSIDEANRKV